ncbi:hypothetical protein HYALB_00005388, partial [Hymenoscyphus albidus]
LLRITLILQLLIPSHPISKLQRHKSPSHPIHNPQNAYQPPHPFASNLTTNDPAEVFALKKELQTFTQITDTLRALIQEERHFPISWERMNLTEALENTMGRWLEMRRHLRDVAQFARGAGKPVVEGEGKGEGEGEGMNREGKVVKGIVDEIIEEIRTLNGDVDMNKNTSSPINITETSAGINTSTSIPIIPRGINDPTIPSIPTITKTPSSPLTLGLILSISLLLTLVVFAYKLYRWHKYGKRSLRTRMEEMELREMVVGKAYGGRYKNRSQVTRYRDEVEEEVEVA